MPSIRPISDLRNHFAEITRDVQSSKEPVFLTKNGVGTLVVMSMECYEENQYENYVYNKLREAEIEAAEKAERFSHEEVMAVARQRLPALEDRRAPNHRFAQCAGRLAGSGRISDHCIGCAKSSGRPVG